MTTAEAGGEKRAVEWSGVDGGGAGRFWRVRQVYEAELVALIALAPVARVPGAGSLPMPAYPRSAEIGDGSAVISGHRGRGSTMACDCKQRVHGPPTLSVGPPGFLPCEDVDSGLVGLVAVRRLERPGRGVSRLL